MNLVPGVEATFKWQSLFRSLMSFSVLNVANFITACS
jgi:hypothetical protein